jgi:hypothetical protein
MSRWPSIALVFGLIAAGLGMAPLAEGQTSYPMLMSIKPTAAQVGKSSEHVIASRYSMLGAFQVLVGGEGVQGEVLAPELKLEELEKKPKLENLKVRFTVAAGALPGVRDVKIVTPTGVSTVGQLVITAEEVIAESAANDTADKAQQAKAPGTICGAIEKAEDVDFYRFHVEAGQELSFHVRCGRLQDRIHDLQQHADPILMLRNAAGVTIAASDNYFFGDPWLIHRFTQTGDYLLEIRDVRYQGNPYWEYAIEASAQPFVENAYPLAISRADLTPGKKLSLQPARSSAEKTAGEFTVTPQMALSPEVNTGFFTTSLTIGGHSSNPVEVLATDLPLVFEAPADNSLPEAAQPVTIPAGINGRIEAEGDVDYFAFEAKKGETFSARIIARRRNSALDSHLRILDAAGKQLQLSDDARIGKRNFSDSWLENWTAPADGKYLVEVRDVHLRGGEQYPYFLELTRAEPYFELYLDTDKTLVSPGASGVLFVRVERKNGFTGEVQLEIEGLPPGVAASAGKIPAGKGVDGCIVITAEPDAQMTAGEIVVRGRSEFSRADGTKVPLVVTASVYQEIYQPGGGRGHWPVNTHAVSITEYGDIRFVSLSTYDITLKPGESLPIEITIDRSPGFTGNVTLDMLYRHLGGVFGDSLPPGVKLEDKGANSLVTGSNTTGRLILKAADDAPPCERHQAVVMAHVALNFVMKSTVASNPVTITVAPK